jgi:hypothetical protein
MKTFSAVGKHNDAWLFDYWAGTDPSGELHSACAILGECETGDVRLGSGLQNVMYLGKAYTTANTEAALKIVQARLTKSSWTLITSDVAML